MKMKTLAKYVSAFAFVAASGSAAAEDASFNASISLIAPITLSSVQDLSFAPQLAGSNEAVVTAAGDSSAAVFSATGEANSPAQASVVESSIEMTTGAGSSASERITVDSFTYGGSLAGDGSTAFDASGNIDDMRIGATANVEADDISGDYAGSATFRLVYL